MFPLFFYEVKLVNLYFDNNTILSWIFFFFLIIYINVLFPAVVAKIFNSTAELVIPIRMSTKEAKKEIETHPVTAEVKIGNCSTCKSFCGSYSLIHYVLYLLRD